MNERIELRYNVVTNAELRSRGVSNALIAQALDCCMMRLSRGVYSIVYRCGHPQHARIRELITDSEWTEYFASTSAEARESDPKFRTHVARLKVIHYPSYRAEDVVTGVSAALLHELPMFDLELEPVTIVHPRAHSEISFATRHVRPVPLQDQVVVTGVRATSPVRTGLDLINVGGAVAGFAALEAVLRSGVISRNGDKWLGMADPRQMDALGREFVESEFVPVAARLTRGRKRAMTILELLSPLSESYAESRCSLNLHLLGLHDFIQQFNVASDGDLLTRLDFLHRETLTAVAVDGIGKYSESGAGRFKRESYQHNLLLTKGYTVVHFNFRELLNLQAFGLKLFEQAPGLLQFQTKPSRV